MNALIKIKQLKFLLLMRHPCTLIYKNGIHDCSGPILKLGYLRLNYFLKKIYFCSSKFNYFNHSCYGEVLIQSQDSVYLHII